MDLSTLPSERELNLLAHYFDCAVDLSRSPFFGKDSLHLGYTGGGSDVTDVRLANRDVLKSMVLTFRKMWMAKEPTYHRNIHNILYRYAPNESAKNVVKSMYARVTNSISDWDHSPVKDYGVRPGRLIDLVVNTEYAHVGMKKESLSKSNELTGIKNQLGPKRVMYLYEHALLMAGSAIYQHGFMVPAAIQYFVGLGCSPPDVHILPEAARHLGVCADHDNVIRDSPGFALSEETQVEALRRVLRRREYRNLVELLDWSYDGSGIEHQDILQCGNLSVLLLLKGIKVVSPSSDNNAHERPDCVRGSTFVGLDNQPRAVGGYNCFRNRSVEFTGEGLGILSDLIVKAVEASKIDPIAERDASEKEMIDQFRQYWMCE